MDNIKVNRTVLFKEYRFIERDESQVNMAWKGTHLLLFFLAFLFGSFCTFCFHMISYMFDEQCVLFPKLLALNKIRNSMIYSFLPIEGSPSDWPVDFITTQWVDKSVCVLPTYVPLVSGIFGLVWTTMFVMCSSSMTQHNLQRQWRLVIPIFIFSIVMSALCAYTSIITVIGLKELCIKLGEATGDTGCSYTINVISLAYSRRIRGVYQATWLIVASAWIHTLCWVCSALVALVRVVLAVDFKLISITVELRGDIDNILERVYDSRINPSSSTALVVKDLTSNEYMYHNVPVGSSDSILSIGTISSIYYNEDTKDKISYIRQILHEIVKSVVTMKLTDENVKKSSKSMSLNDLTTATSSHIENELRQRPKSEEIVGKNGIPEKKSKSSLRSKKILGEKASPHRVEIQSPKVSTHTDNETSNETSSSKGSSEDEHKKNKTD